MDHYYIIFLFWRGSAYTVSIWTIIITIFVFFSFSTYTRVYTVPQGSSKRKPKFYFYQDFNSLDFSSGTLAFCTSYYIRIIQGFLGLSIRIIFSGSEFIFVYPFRWTAFWSPWRGRATASRCWRQGTSGRSNLARWCPGDRTPCLASRNPCTISAKN